MIQLSQVLINLELYLASTVCLQFFFTRYTSTTGSHSVQYNVIITLSGQIMATLANKEAKKGYGLPVSMKLPKLSELYLPFYTAIPGVNYALALLMALEVIK